MDMVFKVRAVASEPPPERFTWEIYREGDPASVERSKASFRLASTALGAGQRALARFLRDRAEKVRQ